MKTDISYTVGRMIYEERLKQGMTQQQLANKLQNKQPNIVDIENGNRNLSLGQLEKMAGVFNKKLIPPKFN